MNIYRYAPPYLLYFMLNHSVVESDRQIGTTILMNYYQNLVGLALTASFVFTCLLTPRLMFDLQRAFIDLESHLLTD
jgi:hypothetical protein